MADRANLIDIPCRTELGSPVYLLKKDQHIVGARIEDGEFDSDTYTALDTAENLRFMARAIGATTIYTAPVPSPGPEDNPPGGPSSAFVGGAVLQKLRATSFMGAITSCFADGRFVVRQQMTLSATPPHDQIRLLHVLSQGHVINTAAGILGIHETRATDRRRELFKTLGTASTFGAVTIGYLAGLLPYAPETA